MPVDEYAAPRGATAIVRTKHEAERQWLPKFEKDIIEGRDPRVAPVRVADQAAFTVGDLSARGFLGTGKCQRR